MKGGGLKGHVRVATVQDLYLITQCIDVVMRYTQTDVNMVLALDALNHIVSETQFIRGVIHVMVQVKELHTNNLIELCTQQPTLTWWAVAAPSPEHPPKNFPLFCWLVGKWRNNREREKAETLNLSGFPPLVS